VWRVFEALAIPTFAVTRQSGQAFVLVVRPARPGEAGGGEVVERRPVDLGLLSGDRWTVTSGVKAGERIAITGLQALRDGQPIKALPPGGSGTRPPSGAGVAPAGGPSPGGR
jgi:multidrug efflux pump subunit AcrA (membrane-fusion protein)